jgi:hypothetical protein
LRERHESIAPSRDVKTTKLILGFWLSISIASTLVLSGCGADSTNATPLPVDAGDAAADAPHDAAADAAAKIVDGGAD